MTTQDMWYRIRDCIVACGAVQYGILYTRGETADGCAVSHTYLNRSLCKTGMYGERNNRFLIRASCRPLGPPVPPSHTRDAGTGAAHRPGRDPTIKHTEYCKGYGVRTFTQSLVCGPIRCMLTKKALSLE